MNLRSKIRVRMPFYLLGICFALNSVVVISWHFNFFEVIVFYSKISPYLSQILGFSLLTNIQFLLSRTRCYYATTSIIGLMCLNLFDCLNLYYNFQEYYFYSAILSFTLFTIALIYFIRENYERR